MVTLVKVLPSERATKKYDAHFLVDGRPRVVSFGAKGYDDFTLTGDTEQRDRYKARHAKDNLDDPLSPGALSWWILWTATSVRGGVKRFRQHFGV